MKTPQRNFVVEFKSGRRRTVIRPGSIWDDTDLKTIVRKAEADAPHLFKKEIVSEPSTIVGDSSQNLGLGPSDDVAYINNGALCSAPETELTLPPRQDHDFSYGQVVKPIMECHDQLPAKTSIGERKSKNNRDSNGRKKRAKGQSTAAQAEEPHDELVSLDEENRRLKTMLIRHLREENLKLQKMLERFLLI